MLNEVEQTMGGSIRIILLTIDETHWLQGAIYIGGMISMMWDPRFSNMF